MAGATTPDNIPYLTITDNVIDAGYTAALATAVQNAINNVSNVGATWMSFTPTFTGLSLGNGSTSCIYWNVGSLVVAKYLITFGTSTSISGNLTVVLPNGDNQGGSAVHATTMSGYYYDSSSSEYIELSGIRSANSTVQVRYAQPVTTGIARTVRAPVTGTAPVTPGNGDQIFLHVIYRRVG